MLRVPAWSESGGTLTMEGESRPAPVGWARAEAVRVGDEVVLDLPMSPRVVSPAPRIDALRGQVAVERGPLVLCLERSAEANHSAEELRVAGDPIDTEDGVILPMVPVRFDDEPWPFGAPAERPLGEHVMVPLIPYHEWGNRGPSTMRVWMPVAGA